MQQVKLHQTERFLNASFPCYEEKRNFGRKEFARIVLAVLDGSKNRKSEIYFRHPIGAGPRLT